MQKIDGQVRCQVSNRGIGVLPKFLKVKECDNWMSDSACYARSSWDALKLGSMIEAWGEEGYHVVWRRDWGRLGTK